jgi:aspartyl-tRNA(Asn)/glutamyl-tRNA(Gln) amidotransferase subunit C
MALTDKDVNHVARLSRLALTDLERAKYRDQLEKILGHIESLKKYDTANVPPTSHAVPVSTAWREDEPRPFSNIEGIMANAPDRDEVFFKVKKVIE